MKQIKRKKQRDWGLEYNIASPTQEQHKRSPVVLSNVILHISLSRAAPAPSLEAQSDMCCE
jgi:hypothetical protein